MINRRKFFQYALGILTPLLLSRKSWSADTKPSIPGKKSPDEKISFVNPDDSLAKLLKFFPDGIKSPDYKGNTCSSCQNYKKKNLFEGKEIGTCEVFSGKYVFSTSFCDSWTQRS